MFHNRKPIKKAIVWVATYPFTLLVFMWICALPETLRTELLSLSERYLWWFTPGLPQEMLTTWNNSPTPPHWAINRAKIHKCFPLPQDERRRLPRSIKIVPGVMELHKESVKAGVLWTQGCIILIAVHKWLDLRPCRAKISTCRASKMLTWPSACSYIKGTFIMLLITSWPATSAAVTSK